VSPDSDARNNCHTHGSSPQHQHQYQRKIHPVTFAYRESLKVNKCSSEHEVPNSRSPNGVTGFDLRLSPMLFPKRPSVTFDDMVEVRVIPNKEMHSQRMSKVLWSNPEEIAVNAHRNYKEFQYESCDWNRAVEDENFLTCPDTGDKIHPVHLHWLDLVMAQARKQRHASRSR